MCVVILFWKSTYEQLCNSCRVHVISFFDANLPSTKVTPCCVRSGNVSPPPYLVWYFSYFFSRFLDSSFYPCSPLCSSWSALKIAYFVFAFEHVFYPTRTHGRHHCQSTYCYSSCAVRNISAAHLPPFWYTHSYTHLISYTQIKSAIIYLLIHCWKFPLQNVFSHRMHSVAYSANHKKRKII